MVALSNCRMERNGVDAIIKDEYEVHSKEDDVMTDSTPALILS